MKIILIAVLLLLFSGPSHSQEASQVARSLWGYSGGHDFRDAPVNSRAPIIINNDGGGVVSDFKEKVQYYASINRPIKVAGSCRSACTLVLAYTNACVYRGAVFKFHMARGAYDGVADRSATAEMIQWMPWSLQDHLRRNIAMDYNSNTIIRGSELIAIGAAREC